MRAGHLLRMLFGYFGAVFVTAASGYLSFALLVIASSRISGQTDWSLFGEGGLRLFWYGFGLVLLLALPVWLLGGFYAERHAIVHKGWYVKAGALGAAAAIVLLALFTLNSDYLSMPGNTGGLLFAAALGICCGALGGFVYWMIAGCKAGAGRSCAS